MPMKSYLWAENEQRAAAWTIAEKVWRTIWALKLAYNDSDVIALYIPSYEITCNMSRLVVKPLIGDKNTTKLAC